MRTSRRPNPAPPAGRRATSRTAPAFTLLELLVALAMAAIIAGSLYSSLRIGFRARTSAEQSVEPVRTAELATSLLRADFESALPAGGTLAGPFLGTDAQGDGGQPADTVSFFTAGNPADAFATAAAAAPAGAFGAPPTAEPAGDARRVEIGLVASPGAYGTTEQVLVRSVTTNLLAQVTAEPSVEVLCRGVRALNVRYFDGLTWQENWDSTQMDDEIPSAVELTVELERTNGGQVKVMRFPRVFLLSCSGITPGTAAVMGGTAGAAQ